MARETDEISAGGRRAQLLGSTASLPTPTVREGYMTADELAAQLGRSVRTLARWRALGEGPPCLRLGREIYYRMSSVAAWLASLEQDAA